MSAWNIFYLIGVLLSVGFYMGLVEKKDFDAYDNWGRVFFMLMIIFALISWGGVVALIIVEFKESKKTTNNKIHVM